MLKKLKSFVQFCWMSLRAYSLYFVLVISLFVMSSILLSTLHRQREANYLVQVSEEQRMHMGVVYFTLKNMADVVFEHVINQDDILEIMALAAKTTVESEQERLRGLLYERLFLTYDNLQKKDLRQLQFHLPESVSFLRFHQPEFYGDSLKGLRYSVDQVNETRKFVGGFEEGALFPAMRHVYPLFAGHEFVGSVELSYSFLAVRSLAYHLFPAIYTLMLDKEIVVGALAPGREKGFSLCGVSSRHVRNNLVIPYIKQELMESDLLSMSDFKKLNKQLRDVVQERLAQNQMFAVAQQLPGIDKVLVASFLPVENVRGQPVAYFVAYHEDATLKSYNQRYFMMQRVTLILTILLLLGGLAYYRQAHGKEKYQALATSDALTGLANRLHFDLVLDQALRQARRSKEPLSLVMVDIDNFKQVNDTYGHDAGDRVLIALAARLQRAIREQDFVARWGGEEFILLLPVTDGGQACQVVEKIRVAVAKIVVPAGADRIRITGSFGVAEFGEDMSRDELLKLADQALYRAKASGKNCVVKA
ncbi:MAG: diguanylate cyclase [Desulfobulbaceae bacterium]|uniref:diguanylate cyclase n=1 Tax=Candidatus Desulfatifera sulfidica TaxID=2841691 RepID=A0A8J6TE50_9BACT|nr:diguanylate cyclase [Candidatus Desulfatifera sulfidica]